MKFKNLGIILFLIAIVLVIIQCPSNAQNQKTKLTKKSEWVWLFNDELLDEWRSLDSEKFPEKGWKIGDGEMIVLAKSNSIPAGKDVISKDKYSNFELELEFKLTEGANSGIKYFVVNDFPGQEGKYLGLEYQLIDDERHIDAKKGKDGNRTLASLYDLIPPSRTKRVNPPGQWNKTTILVDGSHVEHWLNGEKVLEFDRQSDFFRNLVAQSKYNNLKNFGESSDGHILLQGHGDEVSFRLIRIRTW